jgi:hypothetical protein
MSERVTFEQGAADMQGNAVRGNSLRADSGLLHDEVDGGTVCVAIDLGSHEVIKQKEPSIAGSPQAARSANMGLSCSFHKYQ